MLARAANAFEHLRTGIEPASGAIVMGTGIVSVALALEGVETLSRVRLGIAALAYVVGSVDAAPAVTDFGRVWTWVGAAVWLIVGAAALHARWSVNAAAAVDRAAGRVRDEAPVRITRRRSRAAPRWVVVAS